MFEKAQKINLKISLILIALLLLFVNLYLLSLSHNSQSRLLQVIFLNVGQGDAILIKGPGGERILIDSGPSGRALLKALSRHLYFWEKDFDLVLASHADKDHVGAFPEFFKYYKSDYVSHPSFLNNKNNDLSESLLLSLARQRKRGAKFLDLRRADILSFKSGLKLVVLYPPKSFKSKNSNKSSLVIKVLYGKNSILLTGDLPEQQEDILAFFDRDILKSDVLKLGHHGSDTSSSVNFLSFAHPEFAVVSAAKDNKYGHPHIEVIAKAKKLGAKILYSWDGDISFFSDGEKLWLER